MSKRALPLTLIALSLLLLAAGSAQARGRKFSCPLPDKRACASVQEVYDATNNGQQYGEAPVAEPVRRSRSERERPVYVSRPVEPVGGTPVPTPDRCCAPVRTAVTVKGDTLAVASPVSYQGADVPPPELVDATLRSRTEMVVRTTRTEPFRVPAQVIRVYVAPWEDEQGDLHMGGYMFSEIAPRRWSVAAPRRTNYADGLRLLTPTLPSRDAAQDARPGSSVATAQTGRAD